MIPKISATPAITGAAHYACANDILHKTSMLSSSKKIFFFARIDSVKIFCCNINALRQNHDGRPRLHFKGSRTIGPVPLLGTRSHNGTRKMGQVSAHDNLTSLKIALLGRFEEMAEFVMGPPSPVCRLTKEWHWTGSGGDYLVVQGHQRGAFKCFSSGRPSVETAHFNDVAGRDEWGPGDGRDHSHHLMSVEAPRPREGGSR